MINVWDINTGLSALIDKGEFASLPPCNPVTIPGESSGSKSKKKRNLDHRGMKVDKPISLAERLNMITDKVIIFLYVYKLLF